MRVNPRALDASFDFGQSGSLIFRETGDGGMVRDFRGDEQSFRDEVLAGLTRPRKEIACKHLYDDRGAELFDRICELDEYYLTRTELEIMRSHGPEMAKWIGARSLLVEYGSGSGVKTQILLEHLEEPVGYVPIDICHENLTRSVEALSERHPQLEIMPVCADYTSDYEVPADAYDLRQYTEAQVDSGNLAATR